MRTTASEQCFSNFNDYMSHLGNYRFSFSRFGRVGAWDFAFLISFQVVLILLVLGIMVKTILENVLTS